MSYLNPPVLVVLQNAYDKGRLRNGYQYHRWLREFRSSRTGVRLNAVTEDLTNVHYANASPKIGRGPKSILPACKAHLRRAIKRASPRIVLACGVIAEQAVIETWAGDLIAMPHLACRTLTNDLLEQVRKLLRWRLFFYTNGWTRGPYADVTSQSLMRIAVRQCRGSVEIRLMTGTSGERSHPFM
ncbi:MAG: hypothetical protein MOB07_07515 [Acidobacteria bacterium]|nr:hypothetical protein [Acidobacteriota bacterium]